MHCSDILCIKFALGYQVAHGSLVTSWSGHEPRACFKQVFDDDGSGLIIRYDEMIYGDRLSTTVTVRKR